MGRDVPPDPPQADARPGAQELGAAPTLPARAVDPAAATAPLDATLAGAARSLGDLEGAWSAASEALSLYTARGSDDGEIVAARLCALVELDRGSLAAARARLEAGLAKAHAMGAEWRFAAVAWCSPWSRRRSAS